MLKYCGAISKYYSAELKYCGAIPYFCAAEQFFVAPEPFFPAPGSFSLALEPFFPATEPCFCERAPHGEGQRPPVDAWERSCRGRDGYQGARQREDGER